MPLLRQPRRQLYAVRLGARGCASQAAKASERGRARHTAGAEGSPGPWLAVPRMQRVRALAKAEIWSKISLGCSPWKGGWPVSSSKTNTPMPHQSEAFVRPRPINISGGTYSSVPHLVCVRFSPTLLAIPMSANLTKPVSTRGGAGRVLHMRGASRPATAVCLGLEEGWGRAFVVEEDVFRFDVAIDVAMAVNMADGERQACRIKPDPLLGQDVVPAAPCLRPIGSQLRIRSAFEGTNREGAS